MDLDGHLRSLPAPAARLAELCAALWDGSLDPVVLELCRLRMAALLGAAGDQRVRHGPAVAAGLDDDLVATLPSWPTAPRFTPRLRAALAFAEQFVLDPHAVTDELAAEVHRHFTPPEAVTLTTALAVFDALARTTLLLGADPPVGGSRAGIAVALAPERAP